MSFPRALCRRRRLYFISIQTTIARRSSSRVFNRRVFNTFFYVDEKIPAAFEHLDAARVDILAFTTFPDGLWQQVWSNNPNELLNREIRRRIDSVGIFPNRDATTRLVGAVLAEQTDEWAEGRRYLGLDFVAKSRLPLLPNTDQGVTDQPDLELSA